MPKRLFYKDPSTGTETPLLVYTVDTSTVSALQRDKQDKTDSSLDTSVKTIVGAINEVNTIAGNAVPKPYVTGTHRDVLTLDASLNPIWDVKHDGIPCFEVTGDTSPWLAGTVNFGTYLDYEDNVSFMIKTPDSSNAAACTINSKALMMDGSTLPAGQLKANSFYLCQNDSSNSVFQLYDINSYNSMVTNLTTNLVLMETEDEDIETYSKVQIDASLAAIRTEFASLQADVGDYDDFDPSVTYVQNDVARYQGVYWRCTARSTTGQWIQSAWTRTSLVDEIRDIRGLNTSYMEVVNVTATTTDGSTTAGSTVTVIYDSSEGKNPSTLTLDSSGQTAFVENYGTKYYVRPDGITGYQAPSVHSYTAGTPVRNISIKYRKLTSGITVIDNSGGETDIELWDPTNNPTARFIRATDSSLCPGGVSHDNSIIISKLWASQRTSKIWQIEYKDLPSLTNITSSATANLDYNGWQNCENAYSDCTTPNAAGKTFVDLYNDAHAEEEGFTPITIAEYLPAIYYAKNVSELFLDASVYGYLPSMGQLRFMSDNLADINYALEKIGSSAISLNSGNWWSSTEYSGTYSWLLNGGTTYYYYGTKTITTNVLPLFAL